MKKNKSDVYRIKLTNFEIRLMVNALNASRLEMNANGDFGIPVPDYIEENVSTKVVKLIQSYTGVVNKMVWRKF